MTKAQSANIKKHIHHKLSRKMKIYFFMSVIMIGIVIYELFKTGVNPFIALAIGFVGIIAGFFIARSAQVYWHITDQVVTTRIDKIGGIILGVYLIFAFSRRYLIGLFVSGALVFVIAFSLTAGIMIGRFIGTRKTIIKILKKQEII